MVDHAELVANFVSVVGSTPEQARFFLEANNWDLNAAMSNFYEEPSAATAGATAKVPVATSEGAASGPASAAAAKATASGSAPRQGGIATLRDFSSSKSKDNESSDDDEPQSYFAGGEKSGVMVQGPPGKKNPNALIEDIIKQAEASGGAAPREESIQAPEPKKSNFVGSGNRLGSEGESSSSAPPVAVAPPTRSSPAPESMELVTRHLTFWRNGFSLEDGPLMLYSDPANQELLDAIKAGQAPVSFLNVRPGQPVDMNIAKRLDEDFKEPPKAPPKAFEGSGNRLGSTASTSTPPSATVPTSSSSSSAAAPVKLNVDESQPVTSIQIRLADGTRLVVKFNHTHTIQDLRGFINASRPDEASRAYTLQTNFPRKDLEDGQQTVAQAGLLNAVVQQRLL